MKAWGLSHVGQKREINEDAFIIYTSSDCKRGYFAVCDGMGGANAGEVASEEAVIKFADELALSVVDDMQPDYMRDCLLKASTAANAHIFELSSKKPELYGMGTTLVGAMVSGMEAVIVNIGDSRAYLIDEDRMMLITKDHNLVFEMLERGEITEAESLSHPSRNVITRALGVEAQVACDTFALSLKQGQKLLFCSDGLTNEIGEQEILERVRADADGRQVCRELVDLANASGGHDNITVMLVAV